MAATAIRHRRSIQRFTHGISTAVEVGLFLLLGLQVQVSGLVAVAGPGILIALGLVVVARPVAVAVSMAGFRWPWRDVAVVGWLGIRGAVPIVLATYAASSLMGQRLAERPPGSGVRVLLVTRGGVTRAADGTTTFRDGDRLLMSHHRPPRRRPPAAGLAGGRRPDTGALIPPGQPICLAG